MPLRSTGTGYTTTVLGSGGRWTVVRPEVGGGQRPWGAGPGLADSGLGLSGGRGLERPRTPMFAAATGVSWTSTEVIWSSASALVSEISVAFNNAYWACIFHDLPYVVFADEGRVVRVYRFDPPSGRWAELWNSTDGGAPSGFTPASWPCVAANDDDDRLLVCDVGSGGNLITVEFTALGNNFANGAATADYVIAAWENGNPGTGVQSRKVDCAWGPPEFADIDRILNVSDVGASEQGQLPCLVLAEAESSAEVHLFFVTGQGTSQTAAIEYRRGRLT